MLPFAQNTFLLYISHHLEFLLQPTSRPSIAVQRTTPHAIPPHREFDMPPIHPSTADTTNLTSEERSYLEKLLVHKLRSVPNDHIASLRLDDILHCTARTRLLHIPSDIGLPYLLRHRGTMDESSCRPLKEGSKQDESVTRAIWFYRLSTTHQFQRYHDSVRWNIALFTALLTHHFVPEYTDTNNSTQPGQRRGTLRGARELNLTPARVRFMTAYLSAVVEQHTTPTVFDEREQFIRLWRTSSWGLFGIHRSWARKAMQREMKRLSREWHVELAGKHRDMSRFEYEGKVAPFVGCLVPGRPAQRAEGAWSASNGVGGRWDQDVKMENEDVTKDELLDALRAPCSLTTHTGDGRGMTDDTEEALVCDLRNAITCVQSVRPSDMLRVLMRLFPLTEGEMRV